MRIAVVVTAICFSVTGLCSAADAEAAIRKSMSIQAQPLSLALQSLAKDRGLQLVYRSEVVGERQTQGAVGELTAIEALTQLLRGTGLTFSYLDEKAITIIPIESATDSSAGASASTGPYAPTGSQPSFARRFSWLRLSQADTAQTAPAAQTDSSSSEERASSALEEIVVTAERRAESIQSLPIAISAFSGETLINRGIGGLESLQQLAPSLQVYANPGSETVVAIRGITTEIPTIVGEPSVSITQDGLPYADAVLFLGDFFDVERVEVLRGPQGTISGRNATAGAIHIHSSRPTDEFAGGFKATIGNYDQLGVEGYLSGPIIGDRLLGRLAVRTDRADGWVTNTLHDEELGTIDKVQARASFLARLTDNFEAHLILEGLRDRSTPLTGVYVDDGRLRSDTPTLTEALGVPAFNRDRGTVQLHDPTTVETEHGQATLGLNWQLGPSARLAAVTGYVDQKKEAIMGGWGTALPLIVSLGDNHQPQTQVSQEVTLTVDLTDRLDMLVGGLYLDLHSQAFEPLLILPETLNLLFTEQTFNETLTSWAGYTQWRYRLTDDIRLTAGARYTHDTKDGWRNIQATIFDPPIVFFDIDKETFDHSWSAWTPRFAVDYALSDALMLYASASHGFKSGGFTQSVPLDRYEPEFVWNYEAGVKANWLDGRLNTALTGFYMDYTDLQQQLVVLDPDTGAIGNRVVNVTSATITGVELELDAQLTDQFRVNFAGTWLDATYDEMRNPDPLFPELGEPLPEAPGGPNFRDLSGNRAVRAPEWQFNVSGEYRAPLPAVFFGGDWLAVLRASYAWQDRAFFSIFNNKAESEGAYGLVNLFGAIETSNGKWQLAAFVHNLTDQDYRTNTVAFTGLAPVPYSLSQIGNPRRYGISLAYHF